jgi:acyl CoA:acetate/3-ketoacid CoA transferase beta subunit
MLARELLAPDLTVLVAASVQPTTHDIANPMLDADFVARHASGSLSHNDVLDLIHRGGITVQFVSPAQIDQRGRLNASEVPRPDGRRMRLPGPLALPDVAGLVGRLVGYRAGHTRRFLVPEVDYVTGIGSADVLVRRAAGLSGAGLVALVTDLALLRFRPATATVGVDSIAPGVAIADVIAGCGFPLEIDSDVRSDEPMPADALELLERVIDPHGVRGMEVPATRVAARARLESLTT